MMPGPENVSFATVWVGVLPVVSALIVIRGFLRYVERHSFTLFAWYRIVFGVGLLVFLARRGG